MLVDIPSHIEILATKNAFLANYFDLLAIAVLAAIKFANIIDTKNTENLHRQKPLHIGYSYEDHFFVFCITFCITSADLQQRDDYLQLGMDTAISIPIRSVKLAETIWNICTHVGAFRRDNHVVVE